MMNEIALVAGFTLTLVSATLPQVGKLYSYRRVGGLRFVRIGSFGCSFYWTRKGVG